MKVRGREKCAARKVRAPRDQEIFSFPKWDSVLVARGTPPPWSAGIISLAGIGKLILETQSLRGKILVSKNLVPCSEEQSSKTGCSPLRRTVAASTMIPRTRL